MDESRAREILGYQGNDWKGFFAALREQKIGRVNGDAIKLEGLFTADELDAIAWWMRNKNDKA